MLSLLAQRLALSSALLLVVSSLLAAEPAVIIYPQPDPAGGLKVRMICGDRATDAKMALLPHYPNIEAVEAFGNVEFTDTGLAHLAALPKLRSLSLGGGQLSATGFAHLKGNTKLKQLLVSQIPLTDQVAEQIAAIPNLEGLRLRMVSIEPAAWKRLATMTRLRELAINSSTATDADLAGLAGFTQLESLSLQGVGFTSAGLAHLAGNKQLHKLQLINIPLNAEGLSHFSELQSLLVSYAPVSTDAVTELQKLKKLREVTIYNDHVTNADLAAFRPLMQLRTLDFSSTKLTEPSTHELRAALPNTVVNRYRWKHTLADLRALTHDVEVNDAGQVVAVSMLCHERATDAKLVLLQHFPTIERLQIFGGYDLTDAGLRQLPTLPKLRKLEIRSYAVTDAGLKHLDGNRELAEIHLTAPKVTPTGIAELKKLLPDATITAE